MTTLSDWLLAQFAEDEAVARRSIGQRYGDSEAPHLQGCGLNSYDTEPCDCGYPARVLAQCEAVRRIVEEHEHFDFDWPDGADGVSIGCGTCHTDATGASYPGGWCTTLRLLALPYADRPGWREEWRP